MPLVRNMFGNRTNSTHGKKDNEKFRSCVLVESAGESFERHQRIFIIVSNFVTNFCMYATRSIITI